MRHCTFGCAMTYGVSTIAAAVAATTTPPAVTMNRRRSLIGPLSSPRHELMVGTLGHPVPRPNQRLELRVGRVDLPGHGSLLRLFLDDFGRQLPQIAEHWHGELDDLDTTLELGPEPMERDGVLQVEVREAVDHDRRHGMIERPSQIDRERLVRLLVEAELVHGAWLVPAGIVVVTGSLVETENHIGMRRDVLGRVDDASLEGRVDLSRGQRDHGRAGPGGHLATKARDPHLEALVVTDRGDLLPVPASHLGSSRISGAGHEVEGRVGFLPELEAVALVKPGRHPLGIHTEWDRREPLCRWLPGFPEKRPCVKGLDLSLRGRVEALQGVHDLAARKNFDPEPPPAYLLDNLRQALGRPVHHIQGCGPGRGHAPLDLRL